MKRLILIGGPMGVGKTTVCRLLQPRLPNCVFLDGDWCWDARPFLVTEHTKAMVLDNITHLLTAFLSCPDYHNVLFCWVLHDASIWRSIESRLCLEGVQVCRAALVCSPQELERRLMRDVDAGLRTPDVIPRSLERLSRYPLLPGVPCLDTTGLSAEEALHSLAGRLCLPL